MVKIIIEIYYFSQFLSMFLKNRLQKPYSVFGKFIFI